MSPPGVSRGNIGCQGQCYFADRISRCSQGTHSVSFGDAELHQFLLSAGDVISAGFIRP